MKNVLKSIIAVGIFSLSSPALALDLTSLEVSDRTVVAVDGGLTSSIILVAEENSDDQAGSDAYPDEGAVAENDGNEEEAAPEEGAQEEAAPEEGAQEEGTPEEGATDEGTQEEGAQEEAPEEGQKSE